MVRVSIYTVVYTRTRLLPRSMNNNDPIQALDCFHRLSESRSVESLILVLFGNARPSKLDNDVHLRGLHEGQTGPRRITHAPFHVFTARPRDHRSRDCRPDQLVILPFAECDSTSLGGHG